MPTVIENCDGSFFSCNENGFPCSFAFRRHVLKLISIPECTQTSKKGIDKSAIGYAIKLVWDFNDGKLNTKQKTT